MSEQPDYRAMNAGDFLQALGDDAQKWADAFDQIIGGVDRETMVGWFANAIEHSTDVRRNRLVRDEEGWNEFKKGVERQRKFFRELRAA